MWKYVAKATNNRLVANREPGFSGTGPQIRPAFPSGSPPPKEYAMPISRVADLMHPCASATIQSETTLRDAAKRILTTGLDALPVVNADGAFTGLVAQSALIRELMCTRCKSAAIDSIVSHHVDSARNTATLDSVLPLFRSASVTVIPVVDENDYPVGLIHREDVIRYLLNDKEDESPAGSPGTSTSRPHFLDERRQPSDQAKTEE